MKTKTVSLIQGSPEWHAHRKSHLNASELAAAMGVSPYTTRSKLIEQKATGFEPEIDAATQKRFDDGHRFEDQARQWAEEIVGEELFPTTLRAEVDGLPLSVSLDGQTMLSDTIFEHKTLNESLFEALDNGEIPEHYHPQMEQGLLLSGADRCLFMASAGDKETMRYAWYTSRPDLKEKIIRVWRQFCSDVENYVYQPPEVEAIGKAPEQLPALRIEVTGAVTASNLSAFRDHALAVFEGINTDLQTDGDFADAEKTVKWCKDVESRLESAKDHALAQTASIDELFRAIDDIKEQARVKRLELEKLVKARKEAIRREVVMDANEALMAHISKINAALDVPVPNPCPDFAGAIKGKRTVSSLRDAVDTLLAKSKIEISEQAELIRENCKIIDAAGKPFLFRDKAAMAVKDTEWVTGMVAMRVAEHEQAEQKRIEAERERIRAEEEAKLKAAQQPVEREAEQAPQPVEREAEQAPVARAVDTRAIAPARPTDSAIIEAVAKAFSVDRRTACVWIAEVGGRVSA